MTIKRGPGNPQGLTSSTNTYVLGELLGSVHLSSLSFSRGVIGTPSISESFFWTSMMVSAWWSFCLSAYSSHRERRIQSKLNSESGEAERSSKR